jgi:DNA-binding protein HU-beta
MAKLMSKSELIQKIADQHSNGLSRKDIKGVSESLASVGYKELKKTGAFFVPGFAKFVVIKKPATKQRTGINLLQRNPQYSRQSQLGRLSGLAQSRLSKTQWHSMGGGSFLSLNNPPAWVDVGLLNCTERRWR